MLCLAMSLVGCRRFDVTGRWIGGLPIAGGDHCRIRLFPTHRFDFVCDGDLQAGGQGVWVLEGNRLTLRYDWISHRGEALRDKPVDPSWELELRMNRMILRPATGDPVVWERRLAD